MKNKNKAAACFLATTFGSGFFPIAPGTVGALVAIVVLWFLPPISLFTLILATIAFYFVGIWAATLAEEVWEHDAGKINWDEVVGMMVTVIALPKTGIVYIAAFIAFRIFDIIKPAPVRQSEKLPRGWGVMTDDVLAGIYGNILLQIVFRVFIKV